MSASAPGPHLDPTEPPERASGSLSEGGFQATDAEVADMLKIDQCTDAEVLELLKINQCTDAEVADLLDPDRNAAEVDSLLAALDL